jgi:hypothetical protein
MAAAAEPSQILSIAFVYPEGMLSSGWFRAYRKAKRTIRRAGLGAYVSLVPINELTARLDVLVLPPSLGDRAPDLAGARACVVASAEEVQHELDQLIARLLSEGRLGYTPPPEDSLAVHVGFLRVVSPASVDSEDLTG